MRGFGSGLIWGGVIGALGLVVISENTAMPGAASVPEAAIPAATDSMQDQAAATGPSADATATPTTEAAPEPSTKATPEASTQTAPMASAETSTEADQQQAAEPTPVAPAVEPQAEAAAIEPATPESTAPSAEAMSNDGASADPAASESTRQPAALETAATPEAVSPDQATAANDAANATDPLEQTGTAAAAEAVEVPAGSEFARALPDQDPVVPDAPDAPASSDAPAVAAPDPGQTLPETDTASAAAPEPDLAGPEAPGQPEVDSALPDVAMAPSEPSVPSGVEAPQTPAADAAPDGADLPPPPPLTPEEEAIANSAPDTEIQPDPSAETAPPPAEPEQPPDLAVLPSDSPLAPVAPLPEAGLQNDQSAAPSVTGPETGFSGEVAGVVTNRLPRIGDPPAATKEQMAEEAAKSSPIDRFARPFDNPTGKPAFAIILLDNGDPKLDREKLAELPFPVTFALDPTLPNVADLAATYRAAGQEVVMMATGIPEGANASDLEVTFAAHAAALPEAVGVLDQAQGGFQSNRPLATLVVPVIKGQGRGLLTYDAGLNAADQVASRDEVRAATIFRRIDPDGEPVGAIRRALDRAAFKAAQTGRVAVVGEARPETVAALLEWSVEGRAAAVALAPASAVMIAR